MFLQYPLKGYGQTPWSNQLLTATNFCSSLHFTSVIYTMVKTYMERSFCLIYKIQSTIKRSQGLNLEAGIEAGTKKECWLISLLLLAFSGTFFFIWLRLIFPRMVHFSVGWALLHQLEIKKMTNLHAHRPIYRGKLQGSLFLNMSSFVAGW